MAKTGMINNNNKRQKLAKQWANRRAALKAVIMDRDLPLEERFVAQLKLSKMPRNGSKDRVRNRCAITGRPRGVYRKFKLCRNMVREMGNFGLIPGLVKASW